MASNITSPATIIQRLPGIGYDVSWTGTPTGTFSIQVSTDGSAWTNWGSPVSVTSTTIDPVSITSASTGVEFIKYSFGYTGTPYGGFGGSAVNGIFADSVPEPLTLTLFGMGLAGLGALRRRKKAA